MLWDQKHVRILFAPFFALFTLMRSPTSAVTSDMHTQLQQATRARQTLGHCQNYSVETDIQFPTAVDELDFVIVVVESRE